jgi:hypothetical protein
LDERRFVFLAVCVLFCEIPRGISVKVLPVSLSVARDLGSSSRFANYPDQTEISNRSGGSRNGFDDSHMEQ